MLIVICSSNSVMENYIGHLNKIPDAEKYIHVKIMSYGRIHKPFVLFWFLGKNTLGLRMYNPSTGETTDLISVVDYIAQQKIIEKIKYWKSLC